MFLFYTKERFDNDKEDSYVQLVCVYTYRGSTYSPYSYKLLSQRWPEKLTDYSCHNTTVYFCVDY